MEAKPTPNLKLTFKPHPLARHFHFQTIVSSLKLPKNTLVQQTARELTLDAGAGVRLQGFYSAQPAQPSKGLVLLIHGWLGSAEASYNTVIGEHLYRHGYAIFRLNLRDHGQTSHLNPDLFRGDLLDETFNAAQQIAQLEPDRPFHLVGTSLGGSFALRIAWRHLRTSLPNLKHTIAICPPLDPYRTTLALDNGPSIYLAYFRDKWRKAYRQKKAAFPDRYDFAEELAAKTCLAMTQAFVRHHSPYSDELAYFKSYTITPEMMAALRTPTTIIAAQDDPVVPIASFDSFFNLSPYCQLYPQAYGGHVGFIDLFPFRYWTSEAVLAILNHNQV